MGVLAILLIAALPAGAAAPGADTYATAVANYVGGDLPGAANILAALPQRDIQKQVELFFRAVTTDSGDGAKARLEAAAMLHTDYAMLTDLDDDAVGFHIDMAHLLLSFDRSQVQRVRPTGGFSPSQEQVDEQRAREFLPRWYGVASSVLLLRGMDVSALRCIEDGVKVLPTDRHVLLWKGFVSEFQAVWHPPAVLDPRPEMRTALPDADPSAFDLNYRARQWGPAEAAYRRVLSVDSAQLEARLHLGFVLLSLGRPAEAMSELETVSGRAADPVLVYLAHMFLGRVAEQEGDLAGVARAYQAALKVAPHCQTPYVALSLLEDRRGNHARARELVAALVGIPPRERVDDPWWAYHTSRVPVDDIRWLRDRVRR